MTIEGLTVIASSFPAKETMDRFAAAATAKGMTVFARVDHAAGSAAVGLALRATELLIFGSAKAGTPLMQADQTIGIDLPLKALVYQDATGEVWLAYNDPAWLARRHDLGPAVEQTIKAMTAALAALAASATSRDTGEAHP